VVECDLAKVEVAGSNPVSRSRFLFVGSTQSTYRGLGVRGKSSNINKCPIVFVSIMRRVLIPHEVFQSAL
jgi:hypothetical protein